MANHLGATVNRVPEGATLVVRVLWDAWVYAGTARPHLSRVSGAINPWLSSVECGSSYSTCANPRSNQTPQFSKMTLSAQKEKPGAG